MLKPMQKKEKMLNYLSKKDEEEQLYELADEYLSDFYDRNGIEELYEIDDAEY